jgi:hypothetical protein
MPRNSLPGVFEGMKQEHFASDLLGLATS